MFKWNLLYFSLCPLAFILSLGTTEKSLGTSGLLQSIRYLWTLVRSMLSLCYSRLNNLSFLSLTFYVRCSSPYIFVTFRWVCTSTPMSVLYRGAVNWTQEPRCNLTTTQDRGKIFLQAVAFTCTTTVLGWLKEAVVCSCPSLLSLYHLSFQMVYPKPLMVHGFIFSQVQDLASPFVKLHEFLVNPFF